jgi:hypothetical protein
MLTYAEERLRQQQQHKRQEHAAFRYAFDLFSELVLMSRSICTKTTPSVALSAQEARMLAYAGVC